MSYTFLKAKGYNIGKSLVDDSKIDYCKEMIKKAEELGKTLLLPIDSACAKDFPNPIDNKKVKAENKKIDEITDEYMSLDIGVDTVKLFADELRKAKTVIWNGPMGLFENLNFAFGTYAIARVLTELKSCTTIVGGGDSASAVHQFGFDDKISHVSTGGGAFLEFIEGRTLPGIKVLEK